MVGIVFYYNSFWIEYENLTIFPVLYFFTLFVIICLPIFKFGELETFQVKYDINLINIIGIFSLIVSIIPFCEVLIQLPKVIFVNDIAETLAELHDDTIEVRYKFSMISSLFYKVVICLYDVDLLFIFPLLQRKNKSTLSLLAVMGIITLLLTKNMYYFINSSRSTLIWFILSLILLFFIFYRSFSIKIMKSIRKIIIYIGLFVFLLFMTITVGRQQNHYENREDYTMTFFLSRYISEGMLNFNEYIFDTKKHTNGDVCFYPLKQMSGMNPVLKTRDNPEIIEKMEMQFGIPMHVFYTFIGTFVLDIGPVFAFLFWSSLAIFLCKRIKKKIKNNAIPLSFILIVFVYIKIVGTGTTFYAYSYMHGYELISVLFFYFLLKYNKS
jgi:oligosaccharide repeat unit polymerase